MSRNNSVSTAHRSLVLAFLIAAGAGLQMGLAACGAKDPATFIASAQQRLAADDLAAAEIEVRNALEISPRSAAARFLFARVLLASGKVGAAETELQRAREFGHPDEELAVTEAELFMAQQNPARAVQRLADVRAANGVQSAELLIQLARAYRDLGDLDEAVAAASSAQAQHPDNIAAQVLQARLAAAKGDTSTAKQIAARVIDRAPDDPFALLLNADLLAQQPATLPQAIATYRKALERRPRLLDAHTNLVTALLTQGDLHAAAQQVAVMRKALPNRAVTVFYEVLIAYMQQNYVRVREITQQVLRGATVSPQLLFLAGMAELRLGAPAQAEALLTRAVQAMPSGIEPRRELAGLYVRQARSGSALETLKPLLEADVQDQGSWRIAGQAYALVGEFAKADAAFGRAVKIAPADRRTQVEIGKSLIARGQIEPGLDQLKTAAAQDTVGGEADLALLAAHLRRRDMTAALQVVDDLARKQPKSPLPDLMRGRVQQARGDSAAARAAFEQALVKDSKYLAALEGLAALDFADNRPDAARKRYEDLLKRDPKSAVVMLALAKLHRRAGHAEKALGFVDQAVAVNPLDSAVWISAINFHRDAGDHIGALARARSAQTALPDHPLVLAEVAEAQVAGGDLKQAVSTLNRLVDLQPASADSHHRRAQAHLAAGSFELARRSASKALEISPDWPAALRNMIAIEMGDKRTSVALDLARRVQTRLPTDALGWQLEGEAAAAAGQWDSAIAAFRKALDKQESSLIASQLHASLLRGGQTPRAAEFAESWMKRKPDDDVFRAHLAQFAMERMEWALAETHYRQMLRAQPNSPALLNNLAYVLLRQKNPEAVPTAKRAVDAAPYLPELIDTLAHAHEAASQPAKAIEWQSKAVDIAPHQGRYRLALARMYLTSGDKKKAREELERLNRQGGGSAPSDAVQKLLLQAQG